MIFPRALLPLLPQPGGPHPFSGHGKLTEKLSTEELEAYKKLLIFWGFCAIQHFG